MTIITKPFGEKKVTEKVSVPLVLPTVSDESVVSTAILLLLLSIS